MTLASNLRQFSKDDWLNPFSLALIGYYLVMVVLGLLIPDDILSANVWAREFSDFMASIVPQIDRITALGIKPDVNRFYFSVIWGGAPVLFFISLFLILDGRHRGYAIWSMPFTRALVSMVVCLAVVIASQWLYWMDDVTNRQLRFMLGNVFGRSFWGSVVFAFGGPVFGAAFIATFGGWVTGYIPRRIEEQKNG